MAPNDDSQADKPTQLTEQDLGSGSAPRHAGASARPHALPVIPDHELLRVIGRGAYGEVWLARNIMGTHRAVKVVYRDSFDSDRPYEREFSGIQSFEPISRSHESQVDILHVGRNERERYFYYVMELADDANADTLSHPTPAGPDALARQGAGAPSSEIANVESYAPKTVRSELTRHGRFSIPESLEISLALTTALDHLHKHGLIHRDIKPSNVIFVNGLPKLADIGLVTETGVTMSFVGTEGYLPPEGPGSVQADIFSLGKTLYEVATGKDRLEFPELPTLTESPDDEANLFELNEVLLKACSPDKERRYRNTGEMRADLVSLLAGKSVRRSRAVERRLAMLTRVSIAGVALTALLVAGYLYQQFQTRDARRLAQQNRDLAVKETTERQRAEGLLNTLQLKQAENYFETDEAGKGVTYLARMLRQNPADHIAASRLMSALTDRSFALPIRVFEHTGHIGHAQFSPDGKRIVTCSASATNSAARIWDVDTGEVIAGPMRHDGEIYVARFSPDGRYLATASKDRVIRVWDVKTGEAIGAPLRHGEPPSDEADPRVWPEFSADSQMLLTGFGSEVRVWNMPSGEPVPWRLKLTARLEGAEFSPDGRRILTRGDDGVVNLWDARGGAQERALIHHGDHRVTSARFSPDGTRVLLSGGPYVRLWNAQKGEQLLVLRIKGIVNAARFSPDGLRIVTIDSERNARVWDAQTGQILTPPLPHNHPPYHAEFDVTGERLITWHYGGARVWDSRTGQPLTEWMYGWDLSKANLSPDGLRVLAVTLDNTAVLWDVRPSQALNVTLSHHRARVFSAKFSPDGSRVVTAAGAWFAESVIWDRATGSRLARIKHFAEMTYAEFSSDGRRIVTAAGPQARIWDAQTGAPVTEPMRHENTVQSVRFSRDGRKVVTASKDKTVRIWDAQTGRPLTDPLQHTNELRAAEFSPDGRWILSASSRSHTARVWDAHTGMLRVELLNGSHFIDARFSPDGDRIVTAAANGTAQIWDRETGQAIGEPLKHQSYLFSADFSPDGRYLVTTPENEGVRVWDALTARPIAEPLTHKAWRAQFSPDNQRIVTADFFGTARVWDARSGRPLTEPFRHNYPVDYAEFSPDGNCIVTASRDLSARSWELPVSTVPVPPWIPDLADAVAGQRLTEQEVWESVPAARFLALKHQLSAAPETDRYVIWAKWFLADRLARTTSLSSSVTAAEHVDRLLEENRQDTLQEAIRFSPENSVVAARLARLTLAQRADEHPRKNEEAEFLAQLALKLGPTEPEAWGARAEVMEQTGRMPEALDAIKRAVRVNTNGAALWHQKGQLMEKAQRSADALQAYSEAVTSAASNPQGGKILRSALLARAKLLNGTRREKEAAVDVRRALSIQSRDAQTKRALIDLSSHYNQSLQDEILEFWNGKSGRHDLAALPQGIQILAGVPFDIRGVIQVGRAWSKESLPLATRILLDQECRVLHFLHVGDDLVNDNALSGKRYGNYTVEYQDGQKEIIPIQKNESIGLFAEAKAGGSLALAWTGLNEWSIEAGQHIGLFKFSWPNPRPQVRIRSIDLEYSRTAYEVASINSQEVICLIAITAQSEPTPIILRHPQPQTTGEGETVRFGVEAQSEVPLAYQWQLSGVDIPGATNATLAVNAVTREEAGAYTVQVRNAIEDSVFTLTSQPAPLVVNAGGLSFGALRREMFTNINGGKLSDLTNHTRFPNSPDITDLVHQFEAPSDISENYGVRLSGYVVPPATGDYRFYLCSDDEGALFLSTNESPDRKRQITHEPAWNHGRLWTATHLRPKRENVSEPIHLKAGRHYYVEALMKEGGVKDNLAVAWQLPGDPPPENLSPPIPATSLAVPIAWLDSVALSNR